MRGEAAPERRARSDWLHAGTVAVLLGLLYATTAPRTVALEDDGSFILTSHFLGIEHPPGYPLHTLLGKAFSLLPVGTVAYRMHLLSAVLGALSVATVWLCARALRLAPLPSYVAAIALGLSPVFWSQSIIAEVYTLNTFFAFGLMHAALRACPPHACGEAAAKGNASLAAMALLFGLSLSNHWPLMLLVAPGLAILLWPLRREALTRAPLLMAMVGLGLSPYAWLVFRSWSELPISYYGPIDSLREFWFFVSREGYRGVDVSSTAGWGDRLSYFGYFGEQLFIQFVAVGTIVAGIGSVVQWREWGRRVSGALLTAFLLPSVGLILLLGFDYGAIYKHVLHVYPLPAYGIVALWLGLGFAWLSDTFRLRPWVQAVFGLALVLIMLWSGSRVNLRADYDWSERYAKAVLQSLPPNAILLVHQDAEIGAIGYFHLVEGLRPDITLYHPKGLIFGNRLFHPVKTPAHEMAASLRAMVERESRPVASTREFPEGLAQIDRGFYFVFDRSAAGRARTSVEISEEFVQFCFRTLLPGTESDPWTGFVQRELRRRSAGLVAMTYSPDEPKGSTRLRYLDAVSNDFYGAIGIAEGLLANPRGYVSGQLAYYLGRAAELMPADAEKNDRARVFELRGYLRLERGDVRGAIEDLEAAVFVWPVSSNRAIATLENLYRSTGNETGLGALRSRLRR